MNQKEFEDKWHRKLVRPKEHYKIPIKDYFVTAALLEKDGGKFALMATDYNSENKHWITIDLAPEEIDKLEERFEILGDYKNIEFEIIFDIIGTWTDDDETYCIVNTRNLTNGFETRDNKIPLILGNSEIGDKCYDIGWLATTGEKMRRTYRLKKDEYGNLTDKEICDKLIKLKTLIECGLYHFFEV